MKKNVLFAAALTAASSFPAFANTGRIEFVSGNVTLQGANGQQRPIARGTEISTGDTLRTNTGLVQIRYSDGGIVSLREDAEYTVTSYRFSGKADGSEQGLFRLLKGTMRTVTGAVGRVNKQNYTLVTPTATIGIRGTGGVIAVNPVNGATTLYGTSGTWDLRSQTGTSIPVSAGQTGRVNAANQPAEQATAPNPAQPAPAATAQPETTTETFTTAENRTTTGASEAVSSSSGGGSASLVAPMLGTVGTDVVAFTDVATNFPGQAEATVTLSGTALTAWTGKSSFGGNANSVDSKVVGGSVVESGTTGPISWGRIVNATVNQVQTHNGHTSTDVRRIGPNGGLYYATGASTLDMPKTGSFTYSMIPGAQPRPSFRSESTINATLNSFSLTGAFSATGGNVVYNMVLSVNGQSLSGFGSGSIGGNNSASNGFAASGSATGAFCAGTCTSSVSGAFFGPGASHAAAGYLIFNGAATEGVGGLANLQKQ